MLKLIVRQRVNVVSADLPGPTESLYFAGAKLIEIFPLLNLLGSESLGIGALSYAGQFNILAVGDADTYPESTSLLPVRATTSVHWLSPPQASATGALHPETTISCRPKLSWSLVRAMVPYPADGQPRHTRS
jgi:WS/DGAT C-terminal domain